LTFAEAVEQTSFGDSSRSRVPTDDREKFAGERLHPKTAYSRWRPQAEVRRATQQTFSVRGNRPWMQAA